MHHSQNFKYFFKVHAYVCISVHRCMCTQVSRHVEATLGVIPQLPSCLIYWDKVSHQPGIHHWRQVDLPVCPRDLAIPSSPKCWNYKHIPRHDFLNIGSSDQIQILVSFFSTLSWVFGLVLLGLIFSVLFCFPTQKCTHISIKMTLIRSRITTNKNSNNEKPTAL